MNFIEAVKEIQKGKKLKREKDGYEFILEGSTDVTANSIFTNLENIEATDWKIVEETQTFGMGIEQEKKTLSDYWIQIIPNKGLCYPEDKVKASIKELIDWMLDPKQPKPETFEIECKSIKKKAKEIFGDKLI